MNQPAPLEIDTVALKRLQDSGDRPVILDVRESWEVAIAGIDGALAIPLSELQQRVGEVPRDRSLAVICHHGGRSAQATGWLRRQGFERAMNVAGGIDAWATEVDPAMPRY